MRESFVEDQEAAPVGLRLFIRMHLHFDLTATYSNRYISILHFDLTFSPLYFDLSTATYSNRYGGAIGMIGFDGHLNTGLTLRTVRIVNGIAEVRHVDAPRRCAT